MTTIKYIGRTTDFKGKSLWEIVGNLKNFGVGRIVVRSMFERYPEPCYMKIVKVEALPNEEVRKVKVTVEKTFRGRTLPKHVEICSTSYKTDYRLIPKDLENEYCRKEVQPKDEVVLSQTVEFPPLLREFIEQETGTLNPRMPVKMRPNANKCVRIAKDGEKPTIEMTMGLGTPASKNFYDIST